MSDLEKSSSQGNPAYAGVEAQRKQQLHDIPDPDKGRSDEERKTLDRQLMWKIDLHLLPWLSVIYLLNFLGRTNIGNARLEGMEKSLNMTGSDYNMTLMVYFISYSLSEPITNAILKHSTPRIFFTVIVLIWGLNLTLMGLVTSYPGLIAARWFLGITQAGFYPGVTFYLSCWYRSTEIGLRAAIFFSAAALSGSFGGLLAAVIAKMDGMGGHPGWAWIFIIEGIATIVAGLFCYWLIYDWPETAAFLNQDEHLRLQRRIVADKQGKSATDNNKRHIIEAVRDWKTYGYMCIYMGCQVPLYAFSLFLPTIVQGMGYTGTKAQLFTVPPYALATIVTICVGVYADRTKHRGYCSMVCVCFGMTGFIMLLSTDKLAVQYLGTFLGAAGIYPLIPNTLSWVTNNVEGSLKRAIVLGMVIGWGNLNGVVSCNIYISAQKPRYWTGHSVILAYQLFFMLGGTLFMHFALKAENKARHNGERDDMLAGKTPEQLAAAGDRRPDFFYVM